MKKAFSLIGVMIGAVVLIVALGAILSSYISTFTLGDLSRDRTAVMNAVRDRMEQIKNGGFAAAPALNGTFFNLNNFAAGDAVGQITVTDIAGYTDLREIRIAASFRSRARIVGEDQNLNGILDAGEDINGNNLLDSPCELSTLMTR